MKKFTKKEKINGELATRYLNPKAFEIYSNSDPVTVWEYEKEDQTFYAIDFCGAFEDNMSFEELEKFIEIYAE